MSEFNLLKRVARNLRYQELAELNGSVIAIEDWDSIESTVANVVRERTSIAILSDFEPVNPIGFIKYGILDITYQTLQASLPSTYPRSVRLLKNLGWLDDNEFVENEDESPLLELWNDIEQDVVYVRLYLRATHNIEISESKFLSSGISNSPKIKFVMKQLQRIKRPTYDFPNEFTVYDAFISNARNLRIWKNFYL